MLWKFFKAYLLKEYGMQTVGSKCIFRACYEKKLIDDVTLEQLLEIVEIRNVTTHIYDELAAVRISKSIIQHYDSMKALLKSVKISNF